MKKDEACKRIESAQNWGEVAVRGCHLSGNMKNESYDSVLPGQESLRRVHNK